MPTTEPRKESMDGWNKCQPGSLQRFASAQHAKQTRRRLMTVAGAAVTACLLVAVLWQPQPESPTFDRTGQSLRLSCVEVLPSADDYFADRLEPELALRVEEHLKYCRHCHDKYLQRAQELGKELLVQDTKPVGRGSRPVYLAKANATADPSKRTQ